MWFIKWSLTHWGRVTHICVGNLTIIGSDNGLSPDWRQAIIWTIARILLIGPLGTNFNEILISIQTFSFKKMHLKMSSAKWRPFCLGLNVLIYGGQSKMTESFTYNFQPWIYHIAIKITCSMMYWYQVLWILAVEYISFGSGSLVLSGNRHYLNWCRTRSNKPLFKQISNNNYAIWHQCHH